MKTETEKPGTLKTETCYAVVLVDPPPYEGAEPYHFLATDGHGAPAIFDRKHRALCYRDDLRGRGARGQRSKVIRAIVAWGVPEKV